MRIHSTSFAASLLVGALAACHPPAPPEPPPTLRCALSDEATVPPGTELVSDLDGGSVWAVSTADRSLRATALVVPAPDAMTDPLSGDWREWTLPTGGTDFLTAAIGADAGDLITAQPDRLRAWWLSQHVEAMPLADLAGPGGSVRAWRDSDRLFVASAFGAVRVDDGALTVIEFPSARRAVLPERAEDGRTRWVDVVDGAIVADGTHIGRPQAAGSVDQVATGAFAGREVVAWSGYTDGVHRVWWTPIAASEPHDENTAGPVSLLEPGEAATTGIPLDGPAVAMWFASVATGPVLVVSSSEATLVLSLDGLIQPTELPFSVRSLASGGGTVWAVDGAGGLGRVQCTTDS